VFVSQVGNQISFRAEVCDLTAVQTLSTTVHLTERAVRWQDVDVAI
jgi:hypothetical protein